MPKPGFAKSCSHPAFRPASESPPRPYLSSGFHGSANIVAKKRISRRSAAYEKQEKWHDALEDLKKVCELDPSQQMKEFSRIKELEVKAQKQFEADKDKMVGQLKELGDMFDR